MPSDEVLCPLPAGVHAASLFVSITLDHNSYIHRKKARKAFQWVKR